MIDPFWNVTQVPRTVGPTVKPLTKEQLMMLEYVRDGQFVYTAKGQPIDMTGPQCMRIPDDVCQRQSLRHPTEQRSAKHRDPVEMDMGYELPVCNPCYQWGQKVKNKIVNLGLYPVECKSKQHKHPV